MDLNIKPIWRPRYNNTTARRHTKTANNAVKIALITEILMYVFWHSSWNDSPLSWFYFTGSLDKTTNILVFWPKCCWPWRRWSYKSSTLTATRSLSLFTCVTFHSIVHNKYTAYLWRLRSLDITRYCYFFCLVVHFSCVYVQPSALTMLLNRCISPPDRPLFGQYSR